MDTPMLFGVLILIGAAINVSLMIKAAVENK